MNWINSFEILCYVITAVFLFDIWRKKPGLAIKGSAAKNAKQKVAEWL